MEYQHCIGERNNGFTLMETMVTIAIIAILAAVSIPGIAAFMPNYRLKIAVQDVYSNMQSAKMQAIKTNTDYPITFDEGNDSYTLNAARTVDLSYYKSGISYGHPSGSAVIEYTLQTVTFNSKGMTDQDPTLGYEYIYLKNNKDQFYRIGTLATGVIKLQRWTGSAFE